MMTWRASSHSADLFGSFLKDLRNRKIEKGCLLGNIAFLIPVSASVLLTVQFTFSLGSASQFLRQAHEVNRPVQKRQFVISSYSIPLGVIH